MRALLIALVVAPLAVTSTVYAESSHTNFADCTCRYQGADFQEGQTVCARISGKEVTMQCGRNQNITSWKTLQEGCEANGLS